MERKSESETDRRLLSSWKNLPLLFRIGNLYPDNTHCRFLHVLTEYFHNTEHHNENLCCSENVKLIMV
jgi:hypothetical protein